MCLANLCERKRTKKIRKGSAITRQREERRMMRLQQHNPSENTPREEHSVHRPVPCTPPPFIIVDVRNPAHVAAQKRLLLDLALRTVGLLQRNKLIQQKIIELQKETNEYVASVLHNPEEVKFHLHRMRQYGTMMSKSTMETTEALVASRRQIKSEVDD